MNQEPFKKVINNWFDGPSILLISIQMLLGIKISTSEDPHGFMIGFYTLLSIGLLIVLIVKAIFNIKYRLKFWLYLILMILTITIVRFNWSQHQDKKNIEVDINNGI